MAMVEDGDWDDVLGVLMCVGGVLAGLIGFVACLLGLHIFASAGGVESDLGIITVYGVAAAHLVAGVLMGTGGALLLGLSRVMAHLRAIEGRGG